MGLKFGLFFPKRKPYVQVFENRMLRDTLGPKKWKITGDLKNILTRTIIIGVFTQH